MERWILMVCSRILKLYDGCCVLLLKFPVARWIAGRPGKMAVHSLLPYVVRNHSDMEIYGQTAGKKSEKKYMASLALYITAWLILISGPLLRRGMEVTMLDIGQGDCICVQGPKHQNYLIDGGSSDVKRDWKIPNRTISKIPGHCTT